MRVCVLCAVDHWVVGLSVFPEIRFDDSIRPK